MDKENGGVGEEIDVGPTHALMVIPEAERDRWCIDVIKALADAVEKIAAMKNKIKMAKAYKAFLADLRAKRAEILPVVFYMTKPQFRDTVQELIEKFAGYMGEEEAKTGTG